jgi:hypothetical protein
MDEKDRRCRSRGGGEDAKNIMPREVNFRIGDYSKGAPGIEGLYYGTPDQWKKAFQPLLDTLPTGYNVSTPQAMNWIDSVISYSNYDNIDWTTPSPVRTTLSLNSNGSSC